MWDYINALLLGLFFPYFAELYFCAPTASVLYGEVDSPFCAGSASESSFDVGPIHADFHYFQNIALEFLTFAIVPGLIHAQSLWFPMLSVIIEQHERLVVSIMAPKLPCSLNFPLFVLLVNVICFNYVKNSHFDPIIILFLHLIVPKFQSLRIQKLFPIFWKILVQEFVSRDADQIVGHPHPIAIEFQSFQTFGLHLNRKLLESLIFHLLFDVWALGWYMYTMHEIIKCLYFQVSMIHLLPLLFLEILDFLPFHVLFHRHNWDFQYFITIEFWPFRISVSV